MPVAERGGFVSHLLFRLGEAGDSLGGEQPASGPLGKLEAGAGVHDRCLRPAPHQLCLRHRCMSNGGQWEAPCLVGEAERGSVPVEASDIAVIAHRTGDIEQNRTHVDFSGVLTCDGPGCECSDR